MSIELLKSELEKRKEKLHQWSILESELRRDESYVAARGLDQSRTVSKNEIHLSLWVPKDKGRLGYFSQSLKLDDKLTSNIDLMIEKAHLSSEEAWVFPENNQQINYSGSHYQIFSDDLSQASRNVLSDLNQAVKQEKHADFNSAELFITDEEKTRHLSNGFIGTHKRTKIYAEVCFSAQNDNDSNEFLVTRMAAHPEQMDFAELCRISAEGANALLEAEPMESGTYQCMVDSEIIGQIFSDAITHLDAENKYYNMPFQNKGDSFIKDYQGEPFKLSLDPKLEFGLGSCSFNSESLEQKSQVLVDSNSVVENLVSSQMGQYLNQATTTTLGNMVIEANAKKSRKELLETESILEILQFSALFSSPRDLAFSSEIRLARLWQPGQKPRYVRGGNFSGKFTENCRAIKFSSDQIFRNLNEEALEYPRAYKGPAYAVLNDVVVSS